MFQTSPAIFWRNVLVFLDLKVLKDASNMEKLGDLDQKSGCYARDSFWVANSSWYLSSAFREGLLWSSMTCPALGVQCTA